MRQILILSSDLSLFSDLAPAMRRADFNVLCTTDISEGLKRLDEAEVNLVILDELLAVDSWRLCRCIDQIFDTEIIFMGKRPREEAWSIAEETGFDFYLEKPVSLLELSARAKALLRRKESFRS